MRNINDGAAAPLQPLAEWIRLWEGGHPQRPPPGFSKPLVDQTAAHPAPLPEPSQLSAQASQQQPQAQQLAEQQHQPLNAGQYVGLGVQQPEGQLQQHAPLEAGSFLSQLQGQHGTGPLVSALAPGQLSHIGLQHPVGGPHASEQASLLQQNLLQQPLHIMHGAQPKPLQHQPGPQQLGGYGSGSMSAPYAAEGSPAIPQQGTRPRLPLFERLGGIAAPAAEPEQDTEVSQLMELLRQPVRALSFAAALRTSAVGTCLRGFLVGTGT